MPYRLSTHVLTVDANVIHKVDTANPANLYSMWTVFSRCADSVEQGRRLENLSWRLWQREQLVENDKEASSAISTAQTLPRSIPNDHILPDIPQLSGSVDSLADEEAVDLTDSTSLDLVRPHIQRQDSSNKRERHISSDDFEKMVLSIVKDKAPLSAPSPVLTPTSPHKEAPMPVPILERSGSTTTESQSPKESEQESEASPSPDVHPRTTVVRGFSPSQVSIPRVMSHTAATNTSAEPIPEPSSSPAHRPVQAKKPTKFTLGASCSSSEQGQSLETRKPIMPTKKPMFQIGGSSEEEGSLKSALASARPASTLNVQKKQASFSNHVSTHTIESDSNAIESDSEGDYIDESAIDDDDDSSDWEDSIEDSGKSSIDDRFFQRVDSKANLTSRRSLITLMLAQNERPKTLGNHASQSTSAIPRSRMMHSGPSIAASPNDSDEAPLMMKGKRTSNLRPINEIPRSTAQAQPIAAPPSQVHAQAALSPRTTRRNMLATELTESLRRHLLWERQQKSSTANAVLKRRHTSHDVANLKQYPEKPCLKNNEDSNNTSWNQYFSKEAFNGYHSKGW